MGKENKTSMGFLKYDRWSKVIDMLPREKRIIRGIDLGGNQNTAKFLETYLKSKIDVLNINREGKDCIVANLEEKLPIKSKSYDFAFAGEVLEHLRNTDVFFSEMNRILRKDAIVILTTPNLASVFNRIQLLFGQQPRGCHFSDKVGVGKAFRIGHNRLFTLKSLKQMIDFYGFQLIEAGGYCNTEESRDYLFFRKLSSFLPITMQEGLVVKFKKR